MKTHRWADIKGGKLSHAQLERSEGWIEREILETNLRELRAMLGKTQEELAQATDMAQSDLSRTERRTDHLVSTLRRYVEALGGRLEVVADFGDRTFRLKGV